MKKKILFLFIVMLLQLPFLCAQKANVSKAKNKALMENPDFVAARGFIQLALKDSITKKEAYTYYVAGIIGYEENNSLYQKAKQNMPFDMQVKGNAIIESYNYFIEAEKMDRMPDKKGKVKQKYTKDIKEKIKEYYDNLQNLVAFGKYLYEKKAYIDAAKAWDIYLEIPMLNFMNNEIKTDSIYTQIKYFSALASFYGKDHNKAIAKLEKLKNDTFNTSNVYNILYREYIEKQDTTAAEKVLKEGFKKFPNDIYLLEILTNLYIVVYDKPQEALHYLNIAIEKDPKKAQYFLVKANIEEKLGNDDEALVSLNKAITVDPAHGDAHGAIGKIYVSRAVKRLDKANNLKDIKQYNKEVKKTDSIFKESMPFFKKAIELKPNDIEYKKLLKSVYYRLKMDLEFEAISKDIKALE